MRTASCRGAMPSQVDGTTPPSFRVKRNERVVWNVPITYIILYHYILSLISCCLSWFSFKNKKLLWRSVYSKLKKVLERCFFQLHGWLALDKSVSVRWNCIPICWWNRFTTSFFTHSLQCQSSDLLHPLKFTNSTINNWRQSVAQLCNCFCLICLPYVSSDVHPTFFSKNPEFSTAPETSRPPPNFFPLQFDWPRHRGTRPPCCKEPCYRISTIWGKQTHILTKTTCP